MALSEAPLSRYPCAPPAQPGLLLVPPSSLAGDRPTWGLLPRSWLGPGASPAGWSFCGESQGPPPVLCRLGVLLPTWLSRREAG